MIDIIERLMICAKFDPDQKEAAELITRLRIENGKILDGMRDTIRERDILSGENYDLRKENDKLTSAYKNGYHDALEAAADLAFKILTKIEGIDFEVPAKIRELHAAAIRESGQ